jgi:hypothetical protein
MISKSARKDGTPIEHQCPKGLFNLFLLILIVNPSLSD